MTHEELAWKRQALNWLYYATRKDYGFTLEVDRRACWQFIRDEFVKMNQQEEELKHADN